jgi:hypothetical protein
MNRDLHILNIRPVNWESCKKDTIFGTKSGQSGLSQGDMVFVRRTGKDYGCLAIWRFEREEQVISSTIIPWDDAEYQWKQYFSKLVEFSTPFCEEFAGTSKYSAKVSMSSMRLAGSIIYLRAEEGSLYVTALLKEKGPEIPSEVRTILQSMIVAESKTIVNPKPVEINPISKGGDIVGRPINYKGIVYAPLNEAGVILLFSRMMTDLGIIYESSPISYPDMIGRIKGRKGYEKVRIEFEFVASNFFLHKHDPTGCDMIVCWENDLSIEKSAELERNTIKVLALSDLVESDEQNQVFENGAEYRVDG